MNDMNAKQSIRAHCCPVETVIIIAILLYEPVKLVAQAFADWLGRQ